MQGPVFIDTPNQGVRHLHLKNFQNLTHQTGMRITDEGFFHITNRIGPPMGTEARLDSAGNWTKASDRRLKRDIEDAPELLDKVVALVPVEFYYTNQDTETMPHKILGFVAQDVEEIFPQLVSGSGESDAKYLDYTGLVPALVGALKELKQHYDGRLAELERQVAELRG
jgi:hypothetical protein